MDLPDPMPSQAATPPEGLTSPVTIEAWRYWERLRRGRAMPARRDLQPEHITGILPHIMLIEVLRDPLDFHYRLIGTYIDERLRMRYTGRRARELPDKGPGSSIWERLCRVVEERRPVVSLLPYTGPDASLKDAEEIMLPLSDDGERVGTIFDALVFIRKPPESRGRPGSIHPLGRDYSPGS